MPALIVRILLLITAVFSLVAGTAAQTGTPGDSAVFVPVTVDLKGGLRTDVQILVRADRAFIPIKPLFDFIRVPVSFDPVTGRAEGAFLRADNPYSIDATTLSAVIEGRSVALTPDDVIVSGGEMYLRDALYGEIFAIDLKYNPRRLDVTLKTKYRLPVFQERDRELARTRRRPLGQLPEPEVNIERKFIPFNFGRLGYSLTSQLAQYGDPRRTYAFQLGNHLMGGDMDTRVFGTFGRPITTHDVVSRIRWAWLDNPFLKQVYVGDILTTGLMPSTVFGAEVTNRPAPRRFYFTSDAITGPMQDGGAADLYYGGALVDYQPQSVTNEYAFPSIITYGVTMYDVRSYDAFGLERVTQYRIVVPSEMIPPGQVEYSVAGGIFRQWNNEGYGNGIVKWGVNSRLTLGGGVDYYEKSDRPYHPMLTATTRLTDILTGDFILAPSAYSRGLLSVSWPSSASASFRYTWFATDQFYNPRRLRNEAAASLSIPIRSGARRMISVDLTGRQTLLSSGRQRSILASIGGQIGIFSPRVAHRRTWDEISTYGTREEAYTVAALGIRAPGGFLFKATARYYHFDTGWRDARFEFSRRFSKGFWLQLFYERSFYANNTFAGLQVVFYFPFALLRAVVGASETGGLRTSQSVSGSVGYSGETGDFYFDYLSSRVGFGGIVVQPYVDGNGNDIHDPGEEYITKGRLKTTSLFGNGYVRYSPGGFVLEHTLPFEEYFMTLEPQFLDNPLWVPKYSTFSVISEPSKFQRVEVPIVVGGIVRGRVTYLVGGAELSAENLTITIAPEAGEKPGFPKTETSFSTGEFEFLGVPPGRYIVSLNPGQVAQLGYPATQMTRTVEIRALPDGDQVDNIDFRLER
jgi:hypothetical protein